MVKTIIKNKTHYKFKYKRLFNKILKTAAHLNNIKMSSEVNLIIVDEKTIAKLNKEYRSKDVTTDILTFRNDDYELLAKRIGYYMLGDIYMSPSLIEKQAKEFNHSVKREWNYMFAHGVAHTLGYDHKNKADETTMNDFVGKIMMIIGVKR